MSDKFTEIWARVNGARSPLTTSAIFRFAAAVEEAEREECANKIRDLRNQAVTPKFATMRECEAYSHALDAAESAIRARGRQLPQPPPPPTRRSSHARINRST